MKQLCLTGIRACVFDAYGTLFDVNSAAARAKDELAEKWQPLANQWRAKQLQYTWLRALMRRHADFWQVTGDALDYAMATLNIDDPSLRDRLMKLYLELDVYPEVKDALKQLKAGGMKLAILSNGAPSMLAAAVANSGISDLMDAVLSVEDVKTYKPHPSVYGLATRRFGVEARTGLLRVIQRLGCARRQGLWLSRRLVQSLRSGTRTHPRAPGRGNRCARCLA